jgi:hypothetical protein
MQEFSRRHPTDAVDRWIVHADGVLYVYTLNTVGRASEHHRIWDSPERI